MSGKEKKKTEKEITELTGEQLKEVHGGLLAHELTHVTSQKSGAQTTEFFDEADSLKSKSSPDQIRADKSK